MSRYVALKKYVDQSTSIWVVRDTVDDEDIVVYSEAQAMVIEFAFNGISRGDKLYSYTPGNLDDGIEYDGPTQGLH